MSNKSLSLLNGNDIISEILKLDLSNMEFQMNEDRTSFDIASGNRHVSITARPDTDEGLIFQVMMIRETNQKYFIRDLLITPKALIILVIAIQQVLAKLGISPREVQKMINPEPEPPKPPQEDKTNESE